MITSDNKNLSVAQRAEFEGFGKYKIPLKEGNEILERIKNDYPKIDNYLLWRCAVDYVKLPGAVVVVGAAVELVIAARVTQYAVKDVP